MSIDAWWKSLDSYLKGVKTKKKHGVNPWLVVCLFSWLLRHNFSSKETAQCLTEALSTGCGLYVKRYLARQR